MVCNYNEQVNHAETVNLAPRHAPLQCAAKFSGMMPLSLYSDSLTTTNVTVTLLANNVTNTYTHHNRHNMLPAVTTVGDVIMKRINI